MSDHQVWVREELERAVREEIHEYLLAATTAWVADDGVSTDEYMHRLDKLDWLIRLSDAIGLDRARVIRAEVVTAHLAELAAQAELAVPADVVRAWHAATQAAMTGCEPPAHPDDRGFDPAEVVREGLLWLYKVRYDRDLFDQSGLSESYWGGRR